MALAAFAQTPDTTKEVRTAEVMVESNRAFTAASNNEYRMRDLQMMPRNSTQDLLRVVPGLTTSQHAGGGKAEQIFLRGFDCDHGTDININVDGAPVNMVSHGHGQGYADLHFVIPETVEKIDVVKGPYLAAYGDLTTAGAVTFSTADTLSQNLLKAEAGSFNTYRVLGLANTSLGTTKVYAGIEATRTQGFFTIPQEFGRYNAIAKLFSPLSENSVIVGSVTGFTSIWDASGQIPERAVTDGRISQYGSIDPNEGGNTSRLTAQLTFRYTGGSPFEIQASATDYRFRLFSNFTFYAVNPTRGDMIEQTDNRQVYTIKLAKTFFTMTDKLGLKTVLGGSARYDDINTALYSDSARLRFETIRSADIKQTNVGFYADQYVYAGNLTVNFAARADFFNFNVQQENQQRGQTSAVVVSPKLNLTYNVSDQVALYGNTGFGFHSNDARAAVASQNQNTIPRAFGAELGSRISQSTYTVAAAAWLLDLENEFVWIGDEGTTEQAGRSRRVGVDVEARLYATSWFTIGSDLTLSNGWLRDSPTGQNAIPLAPHITLSSFAIATFEVGTFALRMRHIGNRPATEDASIIARGYTVLDFNSTLNLSSSLKLSLQIENLTNVQWREAQFATTSRLQNEPAAVSEIHFTAGTPRSLRLGLTFSR